VGGATRGWGKNHSSFRTTDMGALAGGGNKGEVVKNEEKVRRHNENKTESSRENKFADERVSAKNRLYQPFLQLSSEKKKNEKGREREKGKKAAKNSSSPKNAQQVKETQSAKRTK